ncbi:hypothetical protein Glove_476g89 [Diversispora epigaea]|uniref:Protein kinase domain-containing protein n=1 Tax=Diversispora epigaea TaxID=1348612 RepID=A0A397GL92_9GLOM|nr:hypothetical protein Glove_476g89 [Diversispora epigaea]
MANSLMHLHSNDIIHGSIINKNYFRFFIFPYKNLGLIQYMDPQHLGHFNAFNKNKSSDIFGLGIILWEISSDNPPFKMEYSSHILLNNIVKGKSEMAVPAAPHKYKEIYTEECAIQLHYTPQDEIDKGMFCLFANKSVPKELFATLHNLDEECLEKFIDLWDKCLVP